MKADCETCTNQNCLIKQSISETSAFLKNKNTMLCKKGQTFIMEGSPIQGLFFVHQGKVKVSKTGLYGKEQILRFAKDGEIIGHRGFGVGEFSQINAVALEDSVLCSFHKTDLDEMLRTIPSLTYNLMLLFADELNKSETKVKAIAQMTVREKVIDALLYLVRKFGLKDNVLSIQLSRSDIADFAGTNEEQVIRVISSLKKENLLITKGKSIAIPDKARLSKEIAEHNYFISA